jgi:hypothetical protein
LPALRYVHSLVLLLLVIALAAATAVGSSHSRSSARAAGSCNVGSGRHDGYSYLLALSVRRTSCRSGLNLVRHHGRLTGWGCKKKLLDHNPVQYDARMTCKSGGKQVVWTFTQNT